jgi:hypothetical protein
MSFVAPRPAALAVTVLWVLGVLIARGAANDLLAAFTAAGQGVMIALTGISMVVIWFRRDRFDRLEPRL